MWSYCNKNDKTQSKRENLENRQGKMIIFKGYTADWQLILKINKKVSKKNSVQFSSVSQSCLTLRPHESQQASPPCPSPTPRAYSNSCPSSQWCHPAISSSVIPFSSRPHSLPASASFPMSQLFAWGIYI